MVKKINIEDYVFEINGKDVYKATLDMKLTGYTSMNFITKEKAVYECIEFEVLGLDDQERECGFSFELCMSRDDLKNLDYDVVDFYEYFKDKDSSSAIFESLILYPEEDKWGMLDFNFDVKSKRNMNFRVDLGAILREDENIYKIKLQADPDVFIWFRFNINDIEV